MLLHLLLEYMDYIIAAGRIALEITNLINVGLTVETLIWISSLQANLAEENINILKFLGLENDYEALLRGIKLMLIINSIITVLKLASSCCILCQMFWRKNRNNIYEKLAKFKYSNHLILPTTQDSTIIHDAANRSQGQVSVHDVPSEANRSQDQISVHDVPRAANRSRQDQVSVHDAPSAANRSQDVIVPDASSAATRSRQMKSLREIDGMIARVLNRAQDPSTDTEVTRVAPNSSHGNGTVSRSVNANQTVSTFIGNGTVPSSITGDTTFNGDRTALNSLSGAPKSFSSSLRGNNNTLHTLNDNGTVSSSVRSNQTVSTSFIGNMTAPIYSSTPINRRYPLRNRTPSSRYPEDIYQKDKP